MKKKSKFRFLVFIIVIFLLLFLGIKSYWNHLLSAPNFEDNGKKAFIIYKGESTRAVAQRLEKEGLVRSSTVFSIYVKNFNQGSIQAGRFQLSPSMSAEEIVKELSVGVVDKWVTLLEGWRVEEIAEKLNKELGIKTEEFVKVANEGYMFPDTYLFPPDISASQIVEKMRVNFNKKVNSELQDKIKKQGLSLEEGVILASIVEREGRSDEVRTMVASILLKRHKIGMALNVDAAIQYALGYQKEEKDWWKRHLTKEDLKIESPYNTYLYAGFPPTPISNPSISSLKAVANANPSTPYLYYYHDSKGRSHYGKTLEEHNENIANYP